MDFLKDLVALQTFPTVLIHWRNSEIFSSSVLRLLKSLRSCLELKDRIKVKRWLLRDKKRILNIEYWPKRIVLVTGLLLHCCCLLFLGKAKVKVIFSVDICQWREQLVKPYSVYFLGSKFSSVRSPYNIGTQNYHLEKK